MTVIWKGSVQNFWGEYEDVQCAQENAGTAAVKKVLRSMDHNPFVMMGIVSGKCDINVEIIAAGSYKVIARYGHAQDVDVMTREQVVKMAIRVLEEEDY